MNQPATRESLLALFRAEPAAMVAPKLFTSNRVVGALA